MNKDKIKSKSPSEMHKDHRKRMKETYLKTGFTGMSDVEKLEFILFFAIGRKDTNPVAHRLIDTFGSFQRVLEAPVNELSKVEGMGEHSAIFINSILNICAAYGANKIIDECLSTKNAARIARNLFLGAHIEKFFVVCLNKSNKIIQVKQVGEGTASEVKVDIRDITSAALHTNCERIILMHNHPKGSPEPSDEDVLFTMRALSSCILNDIEVLDHIVVADNLVCSFEETGLLSSLKQEIINSMPNGMIAKEELNFSKKEKEILKACVDKIRNKQK